MVHSHPPLSRGCRLNLEGVSDRRRPHQNLPIYTAAGCHRGSERFMRYPRDYAGIEVRVLNEREVDRVLTALGLARLHQGDGLYLVAWSGDAPLGHLHLALTNPPQLQDVEVARDHR